MTDVKGDGSWSDLEVADTNNTKGKLWVGSELNPPFIAVKRGKLIQGEGPDLPIQPELKDVPGMEVIHCNSQILFHVQVLFG